MKLTIATILFILSCLIIRRSNKMIQWRKEKQNEERKKLYRLTMYSNGEVREWLPKI
ncbi:hypothetical protein B4143_2743 [Bacillus subtilis]|nr:hypothetical protein B4143_2743 [Bacillus subtilis]